MGTRALSKTRTCTIHWNHAFEFLLKSDAPAILSLQLKSQRPEKGALEKTEGEFQFEVSQMATAPRSTLTQTALLPGTDINLKLRFQLLFLEKPMLHEKDRRGSLA